MLFHKATSAWKCHLVLDKEFSNAVTSGLSSALQLMVFLETSGLYHTNKMPILTAKDDCPF